MSEEGYEFEEEIEDDESAELEGSPTDWLYQNYSADEVAEMLGEQARGRPRPAKIHSRSSLLPPLSDLDVAKLFEERRARDTRYVASWGKWLCFDGTRWRPDETLSTFLDIRNLCASLSKDLKGKRDRNEVRSRKKVAAVEGLARAGLPATVDQWDRDPWLLNTPDGVVELRTGSSRPNRADDFCTKITAVPAAPEETPAPIWEKFLDDVTAGDKRLQGFLARAAGYCLTGDVSLHSLFFAHGGGANGKSVFVGTLAGLMGSYAVTTPIETLTASFAERHPTELADLMGARLVVANETERGRAWAESRLKALTGGDRIKARFMRQDFFEFDPTFKLWISGNHKPKLRGVDQAMRRRFNLVPFAVTIPEKERDPRLPEKLKAEWPAILRWAIDGYSAFRQNGLDTPASVRKATNEYFDTEDSVGQWLEECCELGPTKWGVSRGFYASWKLWCERRGERPGSQRGLSNELENRGFTPEKRNREGGRGWAGLHLTPEAQKAVDQGF